MPTGISPGGRPIDESPLSASKTDNWVARNGGLPPYVRGIARGIAKRHGGVVTSADIAAAWQYVKRLAVKSKHPAIRAAAAKAVGQEVVLRARAHSHSNEHNGSDDIDLSEGDSAMAGNLANFGGKRAKPFGAKTAAKDADGLKSDAKKLLKRAKFSGNPGNNSDTKKLPPQLKAAKKRESLNFANGVGKEIDLSYEGFSRLKSSLAAKGATDPGALAAWIGRRKYGAKKFDKAAGKGVKLGHKSKGGKGKK